MTVKKNWEQASKLDFDAQIGKRWSECEDAFMTRAAKKKMGGMKNWGWEIFSF
jgi:hypothetical protein